MKFVILMSALVGGLLAQSNTVVQPNCSVTFTFTTTGNQQFNNLGGNCVRWQLVYSSTGFSALSLVVENAPDNAGSPGSWVTFAGGTSSGSNPNTSTTYATTVFNTPFYYPWLRVRLASISSTGKITGTLYGYTNPSTAGGGGAAFYQTVEQSGSALPQEPILNFTGAGVSCVDNSGATRTTCTISGSGAGNYAQNFTSQTSVVLTHNLNSTAVITACYGGSIASPSNEVIPNTNTPTDANDVTVTFLSSQTGYCVVNASAGGSTKTYHYTPYVAAVSNTTGSPSAFLSQFNSTAAVTNAGPAGPTGGVMGYGVMEFPQSGAQAGIVAHIPPGWDGSSITFTMDAILDTGAGTASLTPYSACIAIGSNGFSIPYNAGSNVLVTSPGGTNPTLVYNLVVPIVGCSAGNLMYIAFARPNTDSLAGNIYLLGGNLGIKY